MGFASHEGTYPIEDVHRLLDMLDDFIPRIDRLPQRLRAEQVPELSEVILELLGWTNTAYIENNLGIDASILSRFVKMRGGLLKSDVRFVADRLRTHLRSQDQRSQSKDAKKTPQGERPESKNPDEQKASATQTRTLIVRGEEWVRVPQRGEVKQRIGAISAMLDSIIQQIGRSNAPEEEQALTALERAELIAILETALHVLRAPMVEKGLMKRAGEELKKAAEKAAEKSVQEGVGSIMGAARDRLLELIASIFT